MRPIQLAPSILSFPMARLFEPVKEMISAGIPIIHFDVMDGQFVPPITFGDAFVESLKGTGEALFEAHLMTQTPERHFEPFIRAGCKRIIFHAEATVHAHRLVQQLHGLGVEAGIAINPATPLSAITEVLDDVDLVLVMTVNPGWGGQKLIPQTLEKVRQLRELRPELAIEVDGGINDQTLTKAIQAGADHLVVGSYLAAQPNLTEAVRHLQSLCG